MLAVRVVTHKSTDNDRVSGYDAVLHNTAYDKGRPTIPGEGRRLLTPAQVKLAACSWGRMDSIKKKKNSANVLTVGSRTAWS